MMSNPTNQYKNPVYPLEATKRGEVYGHTHGYSLSKKGLVFQVDGADPKTYRGYYRFYFSNRRLIDAWLEENSLL